MDAIDGDASENSSEEVYLPYRDELSYDGSDSEERRSASTPKDKDETSTVQVTPCYTAQVKKNVEARRKVLFDSSSDSENDDDFVREDSFAYAVTNGPKW